jgi:protein-S-isoprenylcysteine O-methyltransferase Ste14
MKTLIIFLVVSIPVVYYSRRNIFKINTHGFYRFLAWECIAWLFACNMFVWFKDFFSLHQMISWILLIYSIIVLIPGVIQLKKMGQSKEERKDDALYAFEKTTQLVDTGIYKYIRHPLYSSLIFLTWGILLKQPDLILFLVAAFSTICLYITARRDEKECIGYFGDTYREYMKRSKMFVPYVF